MRSAVPQEPLNVWSFYVSTSQTTASSPPTTGPLVMPPADPLLADRWLNAEEAGQYAGYSAYTMRSFAKRKLVKHTKAPGQSGGYRFKKRWIDDFLESRAIESKTAKAMLEYRKASARAVVGSQGKGVAEIDPELAKAIEREERKRAAREGGSR